MLDARGKEFRKVTSYLTDQAKCRGELPGLLAPLASWTKPPPLLVDVGPQSQSPLQNPQHELEPC